MSELVGVNCLWMRGGTSKGGFFLADDLPQNTAARDKFLLGVMGSPDPNQIDGMGGADPLTSKVGVVRKSERPGIDLDYLFLQVAVDKAVISDSQNCGNILAGIGPFGIERGLVHPTGVVTDVRIYMENSGQTATVRIQTPDGKVEYAGDAAIDGVPGTSAPVLVTFEDTAGANCGTLLPTGNVRDTVQGVDITCIDNGMPCVLLRAEDFGLTGQETREVLDGNEELKERLEKIRLEIGPRMNLGDVTDKTVPKMSLVSAPQTSGGTVNTRTFIPHRCHASIGVLGAVSVATAAALEGSVAADISTLPEASDKPLQIEHPTGALAVVLQRADDGTVESAAILRTARKLFDGTVYAAV